MTLKEVIEKYGIFGCSDFEIIKYYFTENHYEDQAVEMLTEISKSKIKELNWANGYLKEINMYVGAVLYNDIPAEVKIRLYQLCSNFTHRDLDEKELQEAKEIFANNKIRACWNVFYNYLRLNNCIESNRDELTPAEIADIEAFKTKVRGKEW